MIFNQDRGVLQKNIFDVKLISESFLFHISSPGENRALLWVAEEICESLPPSPVPANRLDGGAPDHRLVINDDDDHPHYYPRHNHYQPTCLIAVLLIIG